MNVVAPVLKFVGENPELIGFFGLALAISYPKLPHPEDFVGRWFYFPYLVLHGILARASFLQWNTKGGAVKLPGTMTPSLDAASRAETLKSLADAIQGKETPSQNPPITFEVKTEWDATREISRQAIKDYEKETELL